MTDRAYDPASQNPFDQFDPDKVGALPANQNNKKPDDPFEEFNPFPGQGIKPQSDRTSATEAFGLGAARGVLPSVASFAAFGPGAEAGAAVGGGIATTVAPFTGPLAPLVIGGGAVVGGLAGGIYAAYKAAQYTDAAQNYALTKLPSEWKDPLECEEAAAQQEHPTASFLGGLVPTAITLSPGRIAAGVLPENATAFQRIMAHPATKRLFGAGVMGAIELGNEAAEGQSPDWTKVALSTGFGLVFNKPTRIGEALTEVGAAPMRRLLGRASPEASAPATAPLASEQPTEATQPAPASVEPRPAPPPGVAPTLFHAPTVAQASDLNVMGPGVTREVFDGAHERNPSAAMTAQDDARTESLVTQPPLLPDIHQTARRMDSDLFDKYEELQSRRATLQEWITSEGAENAPVATGHLATLDGELDAMHPQIAAAYRRAAEATGTHTLEPAAVSESWGLFPPPEVRQPAPIDATHTVRSGANSTTDGTVVVDSHIPQFSPKLKDAQGNPANLHDFLAEHETVEAQLMKEGLPYEQAHIRATAAERTKVEAAGVDWTAYTHEIDGYLDHVEHEPNSNPPTQPLHVDPEAAIGHHRSENKPVAETGILGTAPKTIEAQKATIAADVTQQLIAAGRPAVEAEAAGRLVAARYEARAARLGGRAGTAQELYEREGAQIRGPRGTAPAPAGAPPAIIPTPAAEAPIVQFRRDAAEIEQELGEVPAGMTRLWRADRPGQKGTAFTNDLPGLALPFRQAYGGDLSYVDVKTSDLPKYENVAGTAHNAEFNLPQEIAASAKMTEPPPIHVGPKAARGPRAVPQERWSLLQFLTDRGGIRPDDKNIGDVKQSFGDKNHFEPGFGQLIRPGGMTLDRAREAAIEAGYLQDRGGTEEGGGVATTNLDTLLQAIDKEARGTKVYRQGVEPADARIREIDEAEAEHYRAQEAETDKTVSDYLKDVGIKSTDIEPSIMARMRELVSRQRLEPDIAHERVVMEADDYAVETENAPERAEYIPGWDVPDEPRAAQETGEATEKGEAAPGAGARTDREGDREAAWQEFYQRKSLTEQREAEGQQQIPGAEKISDAERAQRAANQPLRPTAEQKPMDEGLFGDSDKQKELFQSDRVTDTPAFEHWFGDSKMVDAKGNPKIFFHGTGATFDQFSPRGTRLGLNTGGIYFSESPTLASVYAEGARREGNPQVYPVFLNLKNPKIIEQPGWWEKLKAKVSGEGIGRKDRATSSASLTPEVIADLKSQGYDGIVNKVWDEVIAFDPTQIKSATGNQGGFDPSDPRILSQGARGKINLLEGRKPIITLMRDANASTFIHESGHQWLEELMRDANHEAAPDDLKTDAKTVQTWLGVDKPENIKTRQHEKFARGFEQYVREGIAPSPELAGVFAKFKNWLMGIYRTISGLGSPINDDIKRVFDRMLSAGPQKTVIAPERTVRPTLADIHAVDARETPANEAEPRGDLVNNEADRYIAEPHPEVAHEIQTRTAEVQAEREAAAGGTTAEPATEAGPNENGPAVLGASSGGAEPEPSSGGVGEGRGAVEEGGGGPVREGNKLPGSDRGPQSSNLARDQPLAPSPAASLGARESPFLDKAGNIRLENLTNDQDVREAIRDAALENDDFIGDRRGVVTDGQVQDLANDLGMEGAEALVKKHVTGQAYNAEQVWALRKLLIQSATEVSAAMKKAAIGTDEDLMAYAIAKDRHQLIQATVAGVTAEAGRALRAFRGMAGEEGAQATNEFIKQATGKTLFQLKAEAKLGAQLDSPAKISKFLNDARDRSFGGMVLEYWINGLISGIATHVTYVQGNIILALEKAGPETAIAAALGAVRKAGGRPGEVVHIGEVGAQLKGAIRGLPGAAEALLEAMRSGQTTLLPGEQARPLMPFSGDTTLAVAKSMSDNPVAWREVGAQAFSMIRGIRDGFVAGAALLKAGGIEGAPLIGANYSTLGQIPDLAIRGVTVLPVGSTIRVPGRSVAAIHSFFRSLNYSMNKSAEAFRTASEEGLTGNDFASRVGDIWQNPTPEIMERSRETATQLTLMGQGGEFVKALSKLTNATVDLPVIGKIAPLKFIDPFVHIGANIIKQAIVERTPVGILSAEIRADLMGKNGNIAQDMASARMIVGTSMALLFGGLAMEGYASGSGPSDPHQSAMWRLAGNQAHSVRIGDIWYQVNRLGPMGMLLSTAADFYDVAHEAAQGDILMAASHIQHAITQNILDESFMRGPADLIKAVEDPGRYGEAYIKNFLSSFVPFSVGMAQMARASDPYSRQARTVMDSIKAKIPGLSETLLPRRDIWGDELPSYEALGHAGVTAIYETRVSHDPVNQAMLNLGIYPAQPIRKIRNVDLTDQQYDDYSRIAGRMTKMRLDAIVKSPDWQTWPNHIKHDVISEVIRQSREAAVGTMFMKYPQIVRDATAAKMKKQQD